MGAMRGRWAGSGEPEPGTAGAASGPTVLRIALGSQLRGRREAAGITREIAGDSIRASTAKISRLELGRVGFKERDVADLLTLYGILDPDERAQFLGLARRANAPGWWHRYADLLPAWFETYLGLEQAATVIRCYELQFVPGLVQTRDYARAVTRLGHTDPDDVERRVELRMRGPPRSRRDRPGTRGPRATGHVAGPATRPRRRPLPGDGPGGPAEVDAPNPRTVRNPRRAGRHQHVGQRSAEIER